MNVRQTSSEIELEHEHGELEPRSYGRRQAPGSYRGSVLGPFFAESRYRMTGSTIKRVSAVHCMRTTPAHGVNGNQALGKASSGPKHEHQIRFEP
jgi:hypothetical protein